ncbi:MAG: RluA family pseudouridine synthase, partial [Pseudomonadota bacterium]
LLVVAKTQAAHAGLSALFAAHDIERVYQAILWGAPDRGDPRFGGLEAVRFEPGTIVIDAPLDRHPTDRKRMAVTAPGKGRRAVTRLTVETCFGPATRPFASLATFRLETGRTHQIRVHAAHIGHALVGDPVYGRARQVSAKDADQATRDVLASFPRQALHAATLGFRHPTTCETLRFDAPLPPDLCTLVAQLRRNGA